MVIAAYLFLQRTGAETSDSGVVVGEPGGGVVASSPQTPEPIATAAPVSTPAPSPTAVPTPAPTPVPTPPPDDNFVAEIFACRSISGAECNDRIRRLDEDDDTFVALVLFDNAVEGDVINAILDGAAGPLEGGAYQLRGSGRGYYYSTFAVSGLPEGDYTLTAIRNGQAVAQTEIEKED